MRTVLILAAGVWLGRRIYTTLADNKARERDVELRKRLDRFLREKLPSATSDEVQQHISVLLK